MTTSSSPAATPLRPLHDYLDRPPAVLCPDRSTFAQVLASATRNASVARRHETSDVGLSSKDRRYELAYPLYLSAATDFLWCCRNLAHAGVEVQDGGQERAASLREKLMGQARKAMQRAEKIREVKGAQWANRWGGGGHQRPRHAQVENQARVLRDSASVNALRFEPWLPAGSSQGAEPQPLPSLSRAQEEAGARFRRPEQAMLLSDGCPLRGHSITQDAVTNCGLVAALEVVAEHDYRWGTALLQKPWRDGVSPTASASYPIRLHYNGCLRTIVVDDQLPHWSTGDLMCAAVSSSPGAAAAQPSPTVILPALIEKAYLTILRTYAPPGSVPAEDLHVLTGWLPEVVDLPAAAIGSSSSSTSTMSFQREKTWQRLWRAWQQGSVLICAGTRVGAQQGATSNGGGADLIPAHSYALLEMSDGDADGQDRTVTLMNPWRPSSTTTAAAAVASSTEGPATPSSAAATQEPMCLSWDIFCTRFATLHLAWDPTKLFSHVAEIHARWAAPSSPGAGYEDGTSGQSGTRKRSTVVRNVELSLTVTQTSTGGRRAALSSSDDEAQEGAGEVWLHLSRHIRRTTPTARRSYIAIHIFEGGHESESDAGRVISLGGNRAGRGDYVSSSHHVVRFQPSFLASEILRSEGPGVSQRGKPLSKRYSVVVALHQEEGEGGEGGEGAQEDVDGGREDQDGEERFTLRCWSSSSHSITLGDAHDGDIDSSPAWTDTLTDSWLQGFSAGGHRLCPTYYTNPQYLLVVPAGTPQGVDVRLTLQTSPPVPCHLCLAYLPDTSSEGSSSSNGQTPVVRHIDNIDSPASLVAQSGAYAAGLTRLRARLPGTGSARPGLYVLVASSFEPGTEASFDVRIDCPQTRVVVSKRAWHGGAAGSETGGPALSVYPIPSEGAGMYAKVAKGRWSVAEGTAAGPPNRGRYHDNPAWVIEVPQAAAGQGGAGGAARCVKAVFRLQAEGSAATQRDGNANGGDEDLSSSLGGLQLAQNDSSTPSTLPRYPATNLSLFSLPSSSADNDTSHLTLHATSGPYHSSATGSPLHSVQLVRGQRYRLVASQWLSGGEGEGAFELKGWCDERGWGWRRVR